MAASRTAGYVALYRALETRCRARPPVFQDPYALRFVAPRLRPLVLAARTRRLQAWLARYADYRAPGARTSAIARTRYIDDVIEGCVREGARQCVILGAGYDCRAQRLPALRGLSVFEVDRADTQALKRKKLPVSGVRYVAVDFLRDDSFQALAAHGWRRDQPTLFVWEGVTNYLDEAAVLRVLGEVGRSARSSIVFTYVHRGAIDGSVPFDGAAQIRANVQKLGEPWRFGALPEEMPALLAGVGLALVEDLGADAYRERYLPPSEQGGGYAFYRVAVARTAPA